MNKTDAMMVSTDLIEQALAEAGGTRRERVIALAELWHRHTGSLPTTKETRDHVGRGSYGDITRDLKDFAAVIAARTERKSTIPGLPLDLELKLNDVLGGLWQTIFERAQQEFAGERETLAAKLDALSDQAADADLGRQHALEDRSTALERLANIERQLTVVLEAADVSEQKVAERDTTIAELQAHIGSLEAEKLRLAAEHLTELRALQMQLKERENRVLDLQSAAETIKSGYEARLQAGIQLEAEHRARASRAEVTVQQTQNRLETTAAELENLRGQLTGMAARLSEIEQSRDQAISRIALLERDLTTKDARRGKI